MKAQRRGSSSVAEIAREYIESHPSVREAVRDDLLNYTALARRIQEEYGVANVEALTVACTRYQRSGRANPPGLAAVLELARQSRLEVHSRVALLRLVDDWTVLDAVLGRGRRAIAERPQGRLFEVFQGTEAVTILCEENLLSNLLSAVPESKRLGVETGLSVLAFRSRPEVEETPGVLAHMAEELFRRGINALDTVSVHADSILVFRERDVIPAFTALSKLSAPTEEGRSRPKPSSQMEQEPVRRAASGTSASSPKIS